MADTPSTVIQADKATLLAAAIWNLYGADNAAKLEALTRDMGMPVVVDVTKNRTTIHYNGIKLPSIRPHKSNVDDFANRIREALKGNSERGVC